MSSPLAKYIYLYYYNTITITFKAATRGCLLFALLTLHTKVLDIIHLLANVPSRLPDPIPSAQHYQPLSIHFSGGKDPSRPGYKRKSFWEMRPGHIRTRQEILAGKKCGMPTRISWQGREKYPYFYECLMLPLFSSKQWMLGTVSFDVEPADRCSTYRWTADLPLGMKHYRYLGCQKLIQVASNRWQLLRDEPDSIQPDIDEVNTYLDNFTGSLSALTLKVKCEEANQLRAYVQRMRLSGSTCNYFSPVSDTPMIFGWVPAGFTWSTARRELFLWTKEDCEHERWWLIEWACPSESRLIQFTTPGLSIIHGLGP
ncbi:hypothetical protein F5Y04DRAFT_254551 [Hypomontagnella monticulosa]|nr:hypothetical protein F5Y04DRAFT_254551 [Hypomontagnella monticulosa]